MQAAPLIAVRQLTKRFPGVVALDDVSLEIERGQCTAICGENGAGKSTLMKVLAGVIPDFEGQYLLRGRAVRFASTREAEQAGVSIIHQELNLVEQLTAAANIFLGREKRSAFGVLDERAMRDAAGRLLAELECHVDPGQRVGQLRVGDQQLVEIAKALSLESEILIMDEPTSALTESEVARLFRVIERLRSRGVTILYISHKMDEVFRLADRIVVLRDGRLVDTLDRHASDPRQVTHLMVGREIEATHFEGRSRGDVLLNVHRLSLPWTGHARGWRLRDISFTLHRGEILGIAGLMGAGRTELLECLFGASPEPPSGRIELEDRVVRFRHPAEARAAGMALVTEDRKRLGLFAAMSVAENITLCQLHDATSAGILRTSRERELATSTIERLGIKTAGGDVPITTLSGGNQQKAIIGRWLLTRPKVLLLDDPTRGIDVGAKAELYRLADELCRQGLGIIVTSSELPELLTLCDRILVLCEGRLTGEFARHEASEQRIMEAATRRALASE
ncbi:MAG TPA: sugar ABC transporter ATP-binding protein [Pirellulales bacterium]|jgi:ABC-type sugar transport system ATPase subunit|nr:sugar ABC transporter ATP-binding protein [Pirellulales bacterium]